MPLKQKMATGFRSLLQGARKLTLGENGTGPAPAKMADLFRATEAEVDGEDCLHDCDSCAVHLPRGFKIDESDVLYGFIKGWSTHVLVATGKTDWVRDVADEKGSVMQALGKGTAPSNGVSVMQLALSFALTHRN